MIRAFNVLIVVGIAVAPKCAKGAEIILLEEAGIQVEDVSADGQVVVRSILQTEPQVAFSAWWWTKLDGIEELELPDGESRSSSVRSVSADGTVIAGAVRRPTVAEPWRWSVEDGWETLELPDGRKSGSAGGISADGSMIVGAGGTLWTDGEIDQSFRESLAEVQRFGEASADRRLSAGYISADGSTVAGTFFNEDNSKELFVWTSQDGPETFGEFRADDRFFPRGISANGLVVVGNLTNEAWRWTQDRAFEELGSGIAEDTNHDGSIVVGHTSVERNERALVWDDSNTSHDLRRLLGDEHGLQDLPNRLSRARGISDDGRVIVGYNTDFDGRPIGEGWVVQLDRPIIVTTGVLGDFNGNAELDAGDLDLLAVELQSDRDVSLFDVNLDVVVNFADREFWVGDLANTFMGDTDLDQDVHFDDFLSLSAGFGEEAAWAQGDFDGNGTVEFEDFLMLSGNFGKTFEGGLTAVPEPCGIGLLAFSLLLGMHLHRTQMGVTGLTR